MAKRKGQAKSGGSVSKTWATECELRAAARNGDLKNVKRLLREPIDPDARDTRRPSRDDLNTWRAVESEYLEEVRGEDVVNDLAPPSHARAELGWAALHLAVRYRHLSVVQELLRAGADVNVTNRYGETPLHCAFLTDFQKLSADEQSRRTQMVKFLLESGAKVDAVDSNETTPLIRATTLPKATESVARLLASGADVNAKNRKSEVPLHIAVTVRAAETVKLLVQWPGIQLNRKLGKKTAYQLAVENKFKGIAKVIAAAGAKT